MKAVIIGLTVCKVKHKAKHDIGAILSVQLFRSFVCLGHVYFYIDCTTYCKLLGSQNAL
jgi:hypothetical protein